MTTDARAPFPDPSGPIEFRPDMPVWARMRSTDTRVFIARFDDDVWSLNPIVQKPTIGSVKLFFTKDKVPPVFKEALKAQAYCMLDRPLPLEMLNAGHGAKEYLAATTIRARLSGTVVPFTRLLDERGVTRLCDVRDADFQAYRDMLETSGIRQHELDYRLFALTCASLYGMYLPDTDRLPLPPWGRPQARRTPRGPARTTQVNTTSPIDRATMVMLLVWSLRFIEDLSDDILRAAEERQARMACLRTRARRGDRARAIAGLEQLRQAGKQLPAVRKGRRNQRAVMYLASELDVSRTVLNTLLPRSPWRDMSIGAGAPLDNVPIEGQIAGKPWVDSVDFYEVPKLVNHLAVACLITIAYLSGMRVEEWRALKRGGCWRTEASSEAPERFEIWSETFKGVTDSQGNTIPEGSVRDHPWWVVEEVHTAVAILERIHPHELLLSARAFGLGGSGSRDRSVATSQVTHHIAAFVEWCNAAADRLQLAGNRIPPDPVGPISGRRFRQTIARDIAEAEESPGQALMALNRQLDHKTIAQTMAYVGVASGAADILEVQRELARHNRRLARGEALAAGDTVSGPATEQYIEVVGQYHDAFQGMSLTDREAEQLRKNPGVEIYDNPGQCLGCAYRPGPARCHRSGASDSEVERGPVISRCDPQCRNVFHTDLHIEQRRREIERLERQLPHVPGPMQERMLEDIEEHKAVIAEHERTGIQAPSAQEREVL